MHPNMVALSMRSTSAGDDILQQFDLHVRRLKLGDAQADFRQIPDPGRIAEQGPQLLDRLIGVGRDDADVNDGRRCYRISCLGFAVRIASGALAGRP
jgi:hypothetical protein